MLGINLAAGIRFSIFVPKLVQWMDLCLPRSAHSKIFCVASSLQHDLWNLEFNKMKRRT